MSIPIIDINAGDTVSSMVDKINYNFTLLSLKGGGPIGVQGIQGIKGWQGVPGMQGTTGQDGASIQPGVPTPAELPNIDPGTIYINNGVIQQVVVIDGENVLQNITNLNLSVQSPFGIPENFNTINKRSEYSNYKFVLGNDINSDTDNQVITNSSDKAELYIKHQNTNKYIKFYNNDFNDASLVGSISHITNNNSNDLIMSAGSSNANIGIALDGFRILLNANNQNKIILSSNYTTFENRKNDNLPVIGTNSHILMETNSETGNLDKINSNSRNLIVIDKNQNDNTLYMLSNSSVKNVIGLETSNSNVNTCIDKIALNKDAEVRFQGDTVDYVKIIANRMAATDRNVMLLSKNGVAIGGLSNSNYTYGKFETTNGDESFGLKIKTPWSNAKYGTYITMRSETNMSASPVIYTSNYWDSIPTDNNSGLSNWQPHNYIDITSNATASVFMREGYSNLITVERKSVGTKNPNDVLHIHGADGGSVPYRGCGSDVVISGGNNIGNNNVYSVGGDVYISGGSSIKFVNSNLMPTSPGQPGQTVSTMMTDVMRFGNVIIGINPLHHQSCFSSDTYSAYQSERNTGTNPEGVGFFDINQVAIHGNRIVLDSNANFRTSTNGFSSIPIKNSSEQKSNPQPWAESINDTTLQVSCVNTVNHYEPIVLEQQDICSHQFLSGVMRRIIRFKINGSDTYNSRVSKDFIRPDEFESIVHPEGLSTNDTILDPGYGSVYFVTEQVWQKVGNVVNVNAFGRWLANRPTEIRPYGANQDDYRNALFHISDNMFLPKCNQADIGKIYIGWNALWFGSHGNPFYNKLLEKWLLKEGYADDDSAHQYRIYNNTTLLNGQPLTTFVLPIVLNGSRASFCYGNGNIYTENQCISTNDTVIIPPTGSVLTSRPVMIGGYNMYFKNIANQTIYWGSEGNTLNTFDNSGDNGALHEKFGKMNSQKTNGEYVFMSGSIQPDNTNQINRRTGGNPQGIWAEINFKPTEIISTDNNIKYQYIYPEALFDEGNLINITISPEKRYQSSVLRPCVGMYTWISMNYSYNLTSGFEDTDKVFQFTHPRS